MCRQRRAIKVIRAEGPHTKAESRCEQTGGDEEMIIVWCVTCSPAPRKVFIIAPLLTVAT